MNSIPFSRHLFLPLLLLLAGAVFAQERKTVEVGVSFAQPIGTVRPLNGINKGPLAPGGIFDVIEEQKELGIPFTRLHDCGWPNPYVVDIHAVFPNPNADPSLPESYDFRLTDEYLAAVRKTGAEPIYRLGESIEHTSVKRYVNPPADPEKWAAICIGIIRHYNEGWANGFKYNIRYWEIWNEPENRPVMWTGTDEDFLRLYSVASRAIKKRFPDVLVGGPGFGALGQFNRYERPHIIPSDFVTKFLKMCRKDNAPLNFFSWHCYTDRPAELAWRAWAVRQLLDSNGFDLTESHLNEWNYLPGNTWKPIGKESTPESRQQFYSEMSGAKGAAFITAALIQLQQTPVDVCNLFHGEMGQFGIFTEQGAKTKAWQALRAFRMLLETPRMLLVHDHSDWSGDSVGGAGLSSDGREATILVSNLSEKETDFRLVWYGFYWTGGVTAEIRIISDDSDFDKVRTENLSVDSPEPAILNLKLKAPSVAVVRLRPKDGAKAQTTIQLTQPAPGLIYQRDSKGYANVPVVGKCMWPKAVVEAKSYGPWGGPSMSEWQQIGVTDAEGSFSGHLRANYTEIEVRVRLKDAPLTARTSIGVGDVFIVVGHSVAHGGSINLRGSSGGIPLPPGDVAKRRLYKRTGDPQYLPPPTIFRANPNSFILPAPAGNGPYFWGEFSELLRNRNPPELRNDPASRGAPALVLNAAFGGTSLEHWAKSARGEQFEHPFVNSKARMPYAQLDHALKLYGSVTGVRAILADHGQNDWPEKDEEKIFQNYKTWIEQARKDAGFPKLAVIVNRQSPGNDEGRIRRVQERVIREIPYCYPGPDYDLLDKAQDTTDGIHLSKSGMEKAAKMWADALTPELLKTIEPMPAK